MKNNDIEQINRNNFKALMNTLSQPGKIQKVQTLFKSNLLAIANTLLYSEVSFFYEGAEDFVLIEAITNSKKDEIQNADYIFCDEVNENLLLKAKIGKDKDPELSATLIFKCKSFKGLKVLLTGPGINKSKEVSLPINKSFITSFNENNSLYPLGNEVYFLNEKNEIMAISRTTKLELI